MVKLTCWSSLRGDYPRRRPMLLAALFVLLLLAVPPVARAINLFPTASRNITASGAGAASFPTDAAVITSAPLSTGAGLTASFAFTSPSIQAPPGGGPQSLVLVSVSNGTNSAGTPNLSSVTVTNGVATVVVTNLHTTNAFNGTLIFSVLVFN
jgi:hypothetical protein